MNFICQFDETGAAAGVNGAKRELLSLCLLPTISVVTLNLSQFDCKPSMPSISYYIVNFLLFPV